MNWRMILGRILNAIPALALLIFGIAGFTPTWWEAAIGMALPFLLWLIGDSPKSWQQIVGRILGLVDPVALLIFGIIGTVPTWWQGMIAVVMPVLMWIIGMIPQKAKS